MIVYFTIIAAFALFFSHYCAWDDNIQTSKNETIHHIKQWLIRACVAVSAIVIISGVGEVLTLTMFGLMSVAVAFLFSAWFRYRLNKLRGKDWHYVSNSNYYDSLFLYVSNELTREPSEPDMWDPDLCAIWMNRINRRAGTIAYATEITLTIAAFSVAAILG